MIGEGELVVIAGVELVEWNQMHQTNGVLSHLPCHFYEPSSPQQPPVAPDNAYTNPMLLKSMIVSVQVHKLEKD